MRCFLGGLLCLMLCLLAACGGEAQPALTGPTGASTADSALPSTQVTQPAEPLPPSWAEFDTVILQPFIPEELQEAYDTAKTQVEQALAPEKVAWIRLCYDPILTQHDCVEEYDPANPAGWRLKDYFANRISLSYTVTCQNESGASSMQQGSIQLRRESDRTLWQADAPTALRAGQSALLRDGAELSVLFDNAVTGYVLEDGTVMAYCRESDALSLQTGQMPWGGEPKPMASEPYFSEVRPYADADLSYEPDWLKGELSMQVGDDGQLGLYRQRKLLWPYFDGTLPHVFSKNWIYYADEEALMRVDYGGRNRQTLYRGAVGDVFYVADDTVFFVAAPEGEAGIYRLYAPEGRCDLLSVEVPNRMEEVGLQPPISNVEAVWSYASPAFLELAEAQRESYEAQYGQLDRITYYGLLEQDFEEYSRVLCYYNSLSREYYEIQSGWVYLEPDRTEENIAQNGAAWWKDFQTVDGERE